MIYSGPFTELNEFYEMLRSDVVIISAREILAQVGTQPSSTSTPPTTPPTPSVESGGNTGLIIGLVIVGVVLLFALIGIAAVLLYIRYTPERKRCHFLAQSE